MASLETMTSSESKIMKDPGCFTDRNKFDQWWTAMKLFLLYQKNLSGIQKILATLSRMLSGPGEYWAYTQIEKYQQEDVAAVAASQPFHRK